MRNIISLVLLLAFLNSCARNPVAEVPGHLRPGNSISVANQAIGGGNEGGLTLGHAPLIDWHAPNVPVMQDGVVDVLYGVSRESIDGEAMRGGHFLYIKVAEQSFTEAHRHSQRRLLNNAQQGQLVRRNQIPTSARLHKRTGLLTPAGSHQGLPHTSATAGKKKITFVEMDESSNSVNVLGSQEVDSNQMNEINRQGVETMVDNFNKLYQEQQNMVKPQDK